jgi:hypothetical protein
MAAYQRNGGNGERKKSGLKNNGIMAAASKMPKN